MTAVEPRTRSWTREEYVRLGELGLFREQRVQLVEGDIIEMSPQSSRHAAAVRLMCLALDRVFGTGYDVRCQLPLDLGEHSQPEPDIAVVEGTPRDYAAHHPATASLVVEVADTSLAYDQTAKKSLYARAGVPEYWVLDLISRRLEVYRQPAPDESQPFACGYSEQETVEEAGQAVPLRSPEAQGIAVSEILP
ncbi:Uma2 family endonuclease [Planctomycetota bacterium]